MRCVDSIVNTIASIVATLVRQGGRYVILSCALAVALELAAAPLAPQARLEIDGLLDRLAASGCEFNRNGSWHSAPEAVVHLKRKLAYLEDHNLVASAEQFIERAGSGSSLSGESYLVRCGGAAPVKSSAWLQGQLAMIRAQKPPKPGP